jgi:hypothetical protein
MTVQLSKEEETLVESVRQLGLSPAKLNRLLAGLSPNALVETSKQEKNKPSLSIDEDLATIYSNAYRRALAVALERKALIDSGLLSEESRPQERQSDNNNLLIELLKNRNQGEKLSFNDVLMLLLVNNLGGGTNKQGDNSLSLRDLLPLLNQKGQLTVQDVVSLLERTKPPPSPPMPVSNSGFDGIFDESVKSILKQKIIDALTQESKKGPPTDWGQVANHVIEAIRGLTSRIPTAESPPPESVNAEMLPPPTSSETSPPEVGTTINPSETNLSSSGTAIPKSLPSEFEEGSGA